MVEAQEPLVTDHADISISMVSPLRENEPVVNNPDPDPDHICYCKCSRLDVQQSSFETGKQVSICGTAADMTIG